MDQFAFHDIPNSIDYILETTYQLSLSYIGFSQGTAQAFAALSTHPTLNDKVDVFIGLAPAMSPAGLQNGVVDALVKASPEVLFLAFGRRSLLSSTTMWQSILYPPIFVRIIDISLTFLFNWTGKNISNRQKLAAYPHLYSFTSTKSVVHWFQIIRNKSFQMYDDDVQAPLSLTASDRYYRVAKFPTRNIKTPVVLIYGGSDSLIDIKVMLKELPRHTVAKEVPHFEHLDFLWAQEVDTLVFPHVLDALTEYAGQNQLNSRAFMHQSPRNGRLAMADPSTCSEGDSSSANDEDSHINHQTNNSTSKTNTPYKKILPTKVYSSSPRNRKHNPPQSLSETDPTSASLDGAGDSNARTSSKPSRTPVNNTKHLRKRSSVSSIRSVDSAKKFGKGGISIGAGKATTGVSNTTRPQVKR